MGDKYGGVPLPYRIEQNEFSHIYSEAFEGGKDVQLLDQWYKLDETSQPPSYVLQSLSSHLRCITHENSILLKEALLRWETTKRQLLEILQESSTVCQIEGKINQAPYEYKQEKYFRSCIHQEVAQALDLNALNIVTISRSFKGISPEDKDAGDYLDLKADKNVDVIAQQSLKALRHLLHMRLKPESIRPTFNLSWHPDGLAPSKSEEHETYLHEFNFAIYSYIVQLIDRELSACLCTDSGNESTKAICREIAFHVHQSYFLNDLMKMRYKELNSTFNSALVAGSKDDHKMVLVRGVEGSGKTVALKYFHELAIKYFTKYSYIVVLRSVKFMQFNQTGLDLLRSICSQLSTVLKRDFVSYSCYSELLRSFVNLLLEFSKSNTYLLIIVDGIQHLRSGSADTENNLDWLAVTLPPKVYMAASVNECHNLNIHLANMVTAKSDWVVDLNNLSESDIVQLINEIQLSKKCLLSREQTLLLMNAAKSMPQPLQISLAVEEVLTQNAEQQQYEILPSTLEKLVLARFKRIESIYGKDIIGHIMRYLTSSYKGITELELLDILSCNNDIMLSVLSLDSLSFLRFPLDIWNEIRSELGSLLVECVADGRRMLCWSHHSVAVAATKRYCQQLDYIKLSHRDFADYFLETWKYNKPLVVPEKGVQIIDTGCRYVCHQPLLLSETTYNLRRLSELWYHLLNAGDLDALKEHIICNFEYLLAKLHSSSVFSLLSDLEVAFATVLDGDVYLILQAITKSVKILTSDPLQLASELLGHLRQLKDKFPGHIKPLIQQCIEWCDSYSLPLLVPLSTWLPDPRSALVLTMKTDQKTRLICSTFNGQHIFSSCEDDHDIRMYHVPSHRLMRIFTGHVGPVTCLRVAHENLVTGSLDGTVRFWDISSGDPKVLCRGHTDAVLCILLTRDDNFIISGSKDMTVRVTCAKTGEVAHSIKAHSDYVTSLTFNNSETVLITGSLDRTVKLWFMDDMSMMYIVDDYITSGVMYLSVSMDNTYLITVCQDNTIHVKSFVTGHHFQELTGYKSQVNAITLSSDCIHCAVACSNGCIYLFNFCSAELLYTYAGHSSSATDIKISSDERFLLSAYEDCVCVWSFFTPNSLTISNDQHTSMVTCVKISLDGKMAITGSCDKLVKLWNMDICDFAENLIGHSGPVTCVDIAGDEAFAVSGAEDCTVKIWSIIMACIITDYQEHQSTVTCVSVLSDNLRVLSAEIVGVMKLWNAETGVTQLSILGPVGHLTLAPNGILGISGNPHQHSLKLWQVTDGSSIQAICHAGLITCLTFSNDSLFLATGSMDMSLKVWEAATGKLTQVLVGHDDIISCVAITDNNQSVVSGSRDNGLLVWNLTTGTVEQELLGHSDQVTTVKVSKDGSIAISGSLDHTLRVWSICHGTQVTVFDMHHPILELHITSDASRLVVQFAESKLLPILCLHNSPAGEIKSQSQINIQLSGESCILPLKPKQETISQFRLSLSEYQNQQKTQHSKSSDCKQETGIKDASPVKAPLQKAVKAQEEKKRVKICCDRESHSYSNVNEKKKPRKNESNICTIL